MIDTPRCVAVSYPILIRFLRPLDITGIHDVTIIIEPEDWKASQCGGCAILLPGLF